MAAVSHQRRGVEEVGGCGIGARRALRCFFFTLLTLQLYANLALLPFRRYYPGTFLPGRIVTDMLRMTTRQIGNPIADFVVMESDDFLLQRLIFFLFPNDRYELSVPKKSIIGNERIIKGIGCRHNHSIKGIANSWEPDNG
jgi:hypothetical protein